jgi:hypothetical protein
MLSSSMNKLLLALLATAAVAHRAAAAPSIVVEAYDGDRPADAATLLAPVTAELTRRGYLAGDGLAGAIDQQVSRAAGTLSASQAADAQTLVGQGYDHFINGEYAEALAKEQQALAVYAAAPATLSREPSLREQEWKAWLVAARSSELLGKGEDAFRLMAEAIRAMPDRAVNTSEFDPSVKALHKKVKDELARQGAGSLDIKVDDATAVIFVDERFAGTGAVSLDGLLPGRYRVYVARGEEPGRVREIDVPAKGRAALVVPWVIDGALRTRPGYVGLERSDNALDAAVRLGRALAAKQVVVLSVRAIEGHRSITAYAIGTESQTKIYGAVQLEPVSPAAAVLTKLGAMLAGDKVDVPGLITHEPSPVRTRRVVGQRPSAMHTLKWVFGAGALVALGTGGALIAIDGGPTPGQLRQPEYHQTKNLGIGVAAGGAALAAVAIYMFATDHPVDIEADVAPGVTLAPSIGPDGVGFALAGSF